MPTKRIAYAGLFGLVNESSKQEFGWIRVAQFKREGSVIYARTLDPSEEDYGQAIYLRPGDTVKFCKGDLSFSLDGLDALVRESTDGYKPITSVLMRWIIICNVLLSKSVPENALRFLLSAARRIDASHQTLEVVRDKLSEFDRTQLDQGSFIYQTELITEIVGLSEMAVIAMNRGLQMLKMVPGKLEVSMSPSSTVISKAAEIKAIRDSYEHIEERAFGLVFRKNDPDALSTFDFAELFQTRRLTYGNNSLNLDSESTQILIEARQYLKGVTDSLIQ